MTDLAEPKERFRRIQFGGIRDDFTLYACITFVGNRIRESGEYIKFNHNETRRKIINMLIFPVDQIGNIITKTKTFDRYHQKEVISQEHEEVNGKVDTRVEKVVAEAEGCVLGGEIEKESLPLHVSHSTQIVNKALHTHETFSINDMSFAPQCLNTSSKARIEDAEFPLKALFHPIELNTDRKRLRELIDTHIEKVKVENYCMEDAECGDVVLVPFSGKGDLSRIGVMAPKDEVHGEVKFYRGKIIAHINNYGVKVELLDYFGSVEARYIDLCPLTKEIFEMPVLGIGMKFDEYISSTHVETPPLELYEYAKGSFVLLWCPGDKRPSIDKYYTGVAINIHGSDTLNFRICKYYGYGNPSFKLLKT